MTTKKETVFLSFDIEADGPSPVTNSMLSLGACLIREDKSVLREWEWKFKPLEGHVQDEDTMDFWSRNKEAYEYSTNDQKDPMEIFSKWKSEILELKLAYDIMPIAWPSAYDWQWVNGYFSLLKTDNPLGYSTFCISTFIKSINPSKSLKFDKDFDASFNDVDYPHTHKPLDDALEQGMKFINAYQWNKDQLKQSK